MSRPYFEDAWKAFERVNIPPAQVGSVIGGKVQSNINSGDFENACAIRLSYVLNQCGCPVSHYDDLSYVSGADGSWHIFRVRDALTYLQRVWGNPDVVVRQTESKALLSAKAGVLLFEVSGWNNASGHATLWDGDRCSDKDYFDIAIKCSLWRLPRR